MSLASLSILAVIIVSWVVANFSNFGFDGWAYHSTSMAWFAQQDRIGSMPLQPFIAWYPKNIEFLSLWIQKLSGNDQFIEAGNVILHLFSIPFAYGIARYCRLDRYWAASAALIYFLTPEIISQSWSTYIDGAFSDSLVIVLFLIFSWHSSNKEQQLFWSVLLGLGLGHLMQSKGSGLYVVSILGCFLLARILLEKDTQKLGTRLLIVAVFVALSGTGWYIKNWNIYGNPVYPFQVALPVTDTILFPGRNFDSLVRPASSPNYQEISPLWLYLSHFAGIGYESGWGAHFFFLGLPAMIFTLFRARNLTWLALFAVAYFAIIPFSFESRYSLGPCIAGAVAFACLCQNVLTTRPWRVALNGISLFTIIISVIAKLDILTNQNANISDADFAQRDGFKRFALVQEEPTARVALVNTHPGADRAHWYFYFGPRWENRVEVFDPSKVPTYDYIICDVALNNCPRLTSHSLVLVEKSRAVYRKNA